MNQATAQQSASVGEALNNARQLLLTHPDAAARQASAILQVEPNIAEVHLILAAALRQLGRLEEAGNAENQGVRVSRSDPVLTKAGELLAADRGREARELLGRFLTDTPNDPEALRLTASIAAKAGNLKEAERLLWRALAAAPSFVEAREQFLEVLKAQAAAYSQPTAGPSSPPSAEEELAEAIRLNEQAVGNHPDNPAIRLSHGHALRLAGRHDDTVAAYRKAIDLNPRYGEAWWSLADLKTSTIGATDQQKMQAQLEGRLSGSNRTGIHFALGKALADEGRYEEAFHHYAKGNALKRKAIGYDVADTEQHVERCKQVFTAEFFASHEGGGVEASDPIFIVGMPRSGSTLVEQILASHSSIEGTEELVYVGNLASFLSGGRKAGLAPSSFVETVESLPNHMLETVGGAYLWSASGHRRSNRPIFIDKMPRNWLYLPLIRLALPNARIIDVRRNAMDCCWSNFRQLFADSGEYSYDLQDLGRYYRAYVDMMTHFDIALPGSVHRVIYEELVADPEEGVTAMLDYLGLPFEPACLKFYENPRAVKTASSEQVRRPINKTGLDQWRPYEQWLGPLEQALGPLAEGVA